MSFNLRALVVCMLTTATMPAALAAPVENYGDPAIAGVIKHAGQSFNVLQVGDSHTAGDFLTGQLRKKLQASLGDGGSGWINPMSVSGQRQTQVKYQQSGWQVLSSRSTQNDYAMGGLLAMPKQAGATLSISPVSATGAAWTVTATLKQGPQDDDLTVQDANGTRYTLAAPVKNNQWQHVTLTLQPPFVVTAQRSPSTALGGWFMRSGSQGATVGAMGINGSQLTHWQRWRDQWVNDLEHYQADLVILSYGTNEAFNSTLDVNAFSDNLTQTIQKIRRNSPQTAILIVGAPESLRSKQSQCGVRSFKLDEVQAAQKRVASQQKTLFWNWQDAMGGSCSMMPWIGQGLGAGDGVHFSAAGYQRSGDDLYDGLMRLMRNPSATQAEQRDLKAPSAQAAPNNGPMPDPSVTEKISTPITCQLDETGAVLMTNIVQPHAKPKKKVPCKRYSSVSNTPETPAKLLEVSSEQWADGASDTADKSSNLAPSQSEQSQTPITTSEDTKQ